LSASIVAAFYNIRHYFYYYLLLDRDGRAVEPTPLGLVALRAAEAKAG
jgi:hypothetical protein